MSIVTINNGEAVTNSAAIADGIKNPHASVIRLVRTYLDDLTEFGGVRFEIEPFDTAGGRQSREVALLNEHQATLLLTYMRNTDEVRQFKKRLVAAFFTLANAKQPAFPQIPQSFAEALQLAANQARQLEEQAPKVEFFDRLVDKQTLMTASQVAQKHGLSAVKLNRFLDELRVYNHGVKRCRVFRQWFIDKGLGAMRQTEQGFSQALFTTAGEAWVCEKLVSEGVAA